MTVHPNSRNPRIEKDLLNMLHIYVSEPALEDKANQAVIKVLAKMHEVSRTKINLISGRRSKLKTFEIA